MLLGQEQNEQERGQRQEDYQIEQGHRAASRESDRDQHDDGTQHHPGRVSANISGLQQPQNASDATRTRANAVHRSIDQAGVHAAPQNNAGDRHQRPNHHRVVDLIDVVFVVDQRVEAIHGFRERVR